MAKTTTTYRAAPKKYRVHGNDLGERHSARNGTVGIGGNTVLRTGPALNRRDRRLIAKLERKGVH
jgi:hypothetical protein